MRRIRNIECYHSRMIPDDNNAARNRTEKRVRNHRILSYLRSRYGQGTWHMPSQGSWAKISGGGIPKGREFQQWPPLHTELSWLNFDISLSLFLSRTASNFPAPPFPISHPRTFPWQTQWNVHGMWQSDVWAWRVQLVFAAKWFMTMHWKVRSRLSTREGKCQ